MSHPTNSSKESKSWMRRLFNWADKHQLPELTWYESINDETMEYNGVWHGFPRDERQLLAMTVLNLDWHDLTELPEELGNLTQLVELSINKCPQGWQIRPEPATDNYLTVIPEWVFELPELRRIDLGGNAIRSIPPNIGRLTKLESLHLAENVISDIPNTIGQCTRLTSLNLRLNEIKSLPAQIGDCKQLTFLSIEQNSFTQFPQEVYACTRLERLLLSSNRIDTIPRGLAQLQHLTDLELIDNLLSEYPEEINALSNLKCLSLSNNCFDDISMSFDTTHTIDYFDLVELDHFTSPIHHDGEYEIYNKRKIKLLD